MVTLDDGTVLVNYTFHSVVLMEKLHDDVIIQPEADAPARLVTHRRRISRYITKVDFGEAVNLPEYRRGIYIIVSAPVKIALRHRIDLVTPNDLLRDRDGNVIGCRTFAL